MAEQIQIQKPGELALGLMPTDIEIQSDSALRIPFDQLPALGAGLASLAGAFSPATSSLSGPTLFTVTDGNGLPIPPSALQAFNDGSGLLGSVRDAETGFKQVRLHVAGTAAQSPIVPFDPTTLAMAAALAVVTQKLDAIQRAQEEMFEYLQQRDKADLRGALQMLADIARDYCFNWDNETFLQSSHAQVLEIRKQADSAITFQRAQVRDKLRGKPLEIRASVETRLTKLLDHLAEYRIATYAHALSSLLEPLLSGNVDADYLHNVSERISAHGLAYRELYTECYNAIEKRSRGALDSALLGGISGAGRALGNALAKTPLGEHTPIDDALTTAGHDVEELNGKITDSLMERLRGMSSPEVLPLQQGVESLASLREKPMAIAADSEALYFIPGD